MASSVIKNDRYNIDCGVEDNITVPANGSVVRAVYFHKTFPTTPQMVVSLTRPYGTADVLTKIQFNVATGSTTGASVTIYNANSTEIGSIGFRWIAVTQ